MNDLVIVHQIRREAMLEFGNDAGVMNDEARMTNVEGVTKAECQNHA